jgi:adenylosuccinate synthase
VCYFFQKLNGLTDSSVGSGIRLAEVFDSELFEMKLRRLATSYARRYGDLLQYDVEDELARFKDYRSKLAHYTIDAVSYVKQAQDRNWNILIEGANAIMLDIDYGTVSISKVLIVDCLEHSSETLLELGCTGVNANALIAK